MISDLRIALRQLRKTPGFTLTAVLTLALGLGATTGIFTLVDQILLKSLPVKNPGELWRIGDIENCCINGGLPVIQGRVGDWTLFSYEQYKEFRDHTPGFASLAAFQADANQLAVRRSGSSGTARPSYVNFVSGNAFDTLGVRALVGRMLRQSDDVRGAAPVAVLSFEAWQRDFGQDRGIVGSTVLINRTPVTVVGIAPPSFFGEQLRDHTPAFWLPIQARPALGDKDALLDHPELQWLNIIGRVPPGANIAALQSQLQIELQQFLRSPLAKVRPDSMDLIPRQYLRLTPGGGGVRQMQEQYSDGLHLLMWISSFVLLIACANIANLMLAKSIGQVRQFAVQSALGAKTVRLVRQALAQSVIIALLGGAVALVVAWGGAKLILNLAFHNQPFGIDPEPSFAVLAFAFTLALITGVLFGIAPAWLAARVDASQALRSAGRATGRHTSWAQKALVIAQAAVSVVLVCAAGALILSLRSMTHKDLGIDTAHRYIVNFDPGTAGYKADQLETLYRRLESSLREIPGVKDVAFSLYTPLDGNNWGEGVWVNGEPEPDPKKGVQVSWDRVSEDYFKAIGTKLVQGRFFTANDNANSRNVAIVNEKFVKRMLHGGPALGRHFGDWSTDTGMYEIVGVVRDAVYLNPNQEIRPMYFLPAKQWSHLPAGTQEAADYDRFIASSHYMTSATIVTMGQQPAIESQVRHAFATINPDLAINGFGTFSHQVQLAFSQQDMIVDLTSLFGAVALVLAGIGLYGVTAYGVAQRTSEIGVRMAIGATRWRIHRLVLKGAFVQVGLGLLIGIPASVLNGQYISSKLFGVDTYDPEVLATAVIVLCGAAVIAAALPARKAASVEPTVALRVQ